MRADPVSLDPTSTTTGATLDAEQFDALPLDRSFRSVAALAPQATYQLPNLAPGSEGVNIAGGSVWDNAYFVDGVDVTDPFIGSSGTNLPYNFLQAVEVKTGGYEAEYGRALGGVVNMVTPTGGNRFEGQVFSFLSDHRLRTAATTGTTSPTSTASPSSTSGSRSPARSGRTGPGFTRATIRSWTTGPRRFRA